MVPLRMFSWLLVLSGALAAQEQGWRVLVEAGESSVNELSAYLGLGEKGAGVDEIWIGKRWRDVVKLADDLIAADKEDHGGHALKYLALLELKGDRTAATRAAVRATKDLGRKPKALGDFINLALYAKPTVSDYQLALMALVPVVPDARDVASVRVAHLRALVGCGKVKEAVATNRDIVKDLGEDPEGLASLVEGLCVTKAKGKDRKPLAGIARQALDKVLESRKRDVAIQMLEFQILYELEGNKKAAHELGEKIIVEGQKNTGLNNWVWYLMTRHSTSGKYPALLLQGARKLAKQNPDPHELDTVALAFFENGLLDEALDFQTQAVKGSGGSASAGMRRRLEIFKTAVARRKPQPASRPSSGR